MTSQEEWQPASEQVNSTEATQKEQVELVDNLFFDEDDEESVLSQISNWVVNAEGVEALEFCLGADFLAEQYSQ